MHRVDQESRPREHAKRDISGSLRYIELQYVTDQEQFSKTQTTTASNGPEAKISLELIGGRDVLAPIQPKSNLVTPEHSGHITVRLDNSNSEEEEEK